ncbi:MAG: type II secretion system GspH family protein [Christensenellaceae bacterium]|nr:type II secretion system GspH family protein [Christensenellaceae bacterium]
MLKLRKNKKGFTLVELIVVIAIMAVLAGVVAGVTVSQLNKNTDKTNLSQAKGIADFVAGEIADITNDSVYEDGELVADNILSVILTQYASVNFAKNNDGTISDTPASKGQFAVKVNEESGKVTSVDILYKNKTGEGDIKGYTVSAEGVITNYPAPAGNGNQD